MTVSGQDNFRPAARQQAIYELLRTLMLYKAKDPVETAKLFSDFCSKIREQDD
ncbi:MAG: hypothetical protein L3J49_02860 [Desulfobulbaceae bacterium]|nr:hypothetical protein [Desulfobulbaceae bacterium]